jgi:hypothetical protein
MTSPEVWPDILVSYGATLAPQMPLFPNLSFGQSL